MLKICSSRPNSSRLPLLFFPEFNKIRKNKDLFGPVVGEDFSSKEEKALRFRITLTVEKEAEASKALGSRSECSLHATQKKKQYLEWFLTESFKSGFSKEYTKVEKTR